MSNKIPARCGDCGKPILNLNHRCVAIAHAHKLIHEGKDPYVVPFRFRRQAMRIHMAQCE